MNKSIVTIALVIAAISGGANAATTQTAGTDLTAKTSPSTIWTTGELGFVQNPNYVASAKMDKTQAQIAVQTPTQVPAQQMASKRKDVSITY